LQVDRNRVEEKSSAAVMRGPFVSEARSKKSTTACIIERFYNREILSQVAFSRELTVFKREHNHCKKRSFQKMTVDPSDSTGMARVLRRYDLLNYVFPFTMNSTFPLVD
jgi:hypothetical protein